MLVQATDMQLKLDNSNRLSTSNSVTVSALYINEAN